MPDIKILRVERVYDEHSEVRYGDGTVIEGAWLNMVFYENPNPVPDQDGNVPLVQIPISDRAVWNRMGWLGCTKEEALEAIFHEVHSPEGGQGELMTPVERARARATHPITGRTVFKKALAGIPDPDPQLLEWAEAEVQAAKGRVKAAALRGKRPSELPISPKRVRHPEAKEQQ